MGYLIWILVYLSILVNISKEIEIELYPLNHITKIKLNFTDYNITQSGWVNTYISASIFNQESSVAEVEACLLKPLEKQTFQNIAAFKNESLFFLREALQKVEGFQINRSSSKESKK